MKMPRSRTISNRRTDRSDLPLALLPVSTSTGSDQSVAIIKRFLDSTELNIRPASFMPTRLIAVATAMSDTVRLVSGDSIGGRSGLNPEYVALSHCWGPRPTFKTLTEDSLPVFCEGIPIASLSTNFQQAISIAQRLGFCYIWIDSLCIIQGDSDDFIHEAGKMADVYRHASFTIVAASAWAGQEGFFVAQNPLASSACLFAAQNGKGDSRTLPVYVEADTWDERLTQLADVKMSMWNTRAWCFQERLLSQRIVYFGATQLVFERKLSTGIHDLFKAELGSQSAWWHDGRVRVGSKWTSDIYEEPSSFSIAVSHVWWDLILEYSSKRLTNRSDRLPAIGGLARLLQKELSLHIELRSGYVAGLWETNIAGDLLWYVSRPYLHSSGRDEDAKFFTAPSWSWASVNAIIQNASRDSWNSTSRIEILSIDKMVGEDNALRPGRTSPVPSLTETNSPHSAEQTRLDAGIVSINHGASITVKGKLRKLRWCVQSRAANKLLYYAPKIWEPEVVFDPDDESYAIKRHATKTVDFAGGRRQGYSAAVSTNPGDGPLAYELLTYGEERPAGWLIPDHREELPRSIYCLRINVEPQEKFHREDPFVPWRTRGIVLTPVEKNEDKNGKVGSERGRRNRKRREINRERVSESRQTREEIQASIDASGLAESSRRTRLTAFDDDIELEDIDIGPEEFHETTDTSGEESGHSENDARPRREPARPRTYRRVGYFELRHKDGGLLWPDIISGQISPRGMREPVRRPPNTDPLDLFGEHCPEKVIKII